MQPTDYDNDVTYNDLEKLLAEFKESMEVLKQKMKEDADKGGDNEIDPD